MKTFKIILILAACTISIAWLFILDYSDLRWSNNSPAYLGLITNAIVILSMTGSILLNNRKTR